MFFFVFFSIPILLLTYYFKNIKFNKPIDYYQSINDRMKILEYNSEKTNIVKPYQSFLIRLYYINVDKKDNKNKTLDKNFIKTLLFTAKDLLEYLNISTVFVHYNEIILIFKPKMTKEEYIKNSSNLKHLYNGHIHKLITRLTSFTTSSFINNNNNSLYLSFIYDKINKENMNKELDELKYNNFNFGAVLTIIPENQTYEIVNNIIYNSLNRGYNNFISNLCQNNFSNKNINELSISEKELLLRVYKGIYLEDFPYHMKFGWYLKFTKNKKIVAKSFKITNSPLIEKMLLDDFWEDVDKSITFNDVYEFH